MVNFKYSNFSEILTINSALFKKLTTSLENFLFIFTAITSSRASGGLAQMYSSYAIKIAKETNLNKISNGKLILY